MKVCFIATNTFAHSGGSELLWTRAADALCRRGDQVNLIVPRFPTEPDFYNFIRGNGGNVHFYLRQRVSLYDRAIHYILGDEKTALIKTLKLDGTDLVIISQAGSMDGLNWVEYCTEAGVPFITISQAVRFPEWPVDEMVSRIRNGYSRAKQNLFVSQGNLDLFKMWLGGNFEPARVTPNPCQVPYDVKVSWPEPSPVFRLACVARIAPADKGHDLILQVMNKPKWRERPIEIHLYGSGASTQTFSNLIRHYKLTTKIVSHGQVADIPKIWSENHGLILPSRSEGFSLAFIEASLCNRFTITTHVADNEKVISDGESGFLASSQTVLGLEMAMEAAWQNRDRWQAIGEKAGKAIRRVVPANPEQVLIQEIERCIRDVGPDTSRNKEAA